MVIAGQSETIVSLSGRGGIRPDERLRFPGVRAPKPLLSHDAERELSPRQLELLDEIATRRQAIYERYSEMLQPMEDREWLEPDGLQLAQAGLGAGHWSGTLRFHRYHTLSFAEIP